MNKGDRELVALLRETLPAVGEPPPPVGLWPHLEQRLGAGRSRPGRLDWLLAGLVAALFACFPEAVLLVLYHF